MRAYVTWTHSGDSPPSSSAPSCSSRSAPASSRRSCSAPTPTASYLSINLGWGLGVMFGVLVAGGVSGAHLNPAVTVALAVHRGLPWGKVAPYAAGADGRRVRRRGAGLRHLPRGVRRLRRRRAAGRRRAGHRRHLRHVSAAVPVDSPAASSTRSSARRCSSSASSPSATRSNVAAPAWTRAGAGRRCWSSASAWPSASTPATPSTRRATSGRGSSRPWPAGAAACSPPAAAGGGCRSSAPIDRRRSLGGASTTSASRGSHPAAERRDEPLRAGPRPGHDLEPRDRLRPRRPRRGDGAAGVPADLPAARPRGARPRGHLAHAAADGARRDGAGRGDARPTSPPSA